MILVVEIGGTKLQLAVFDPDQAQLKDCQRFKINSTEGAAGILHQIQAAAPELLDRHPITRCGVGFGGPVRSDGSIYKSHQIRGWDNFELATWLTQLTGVPAVVANDCDAAAMAEAHYGAGRGSRCVLYVTVGTGVGGGWVLDGQRLGADRPAVGEIGHLRPGLNCQDSEATVESYSSGWGIMQQVHRLAEEVRAWVDQGRLSYDTFVELSHLSGAPPEHEQLQASLDWYDGLRQELTTEQIAEGARRGLWLPATGLKLGTTVLGWAIAQAVTLVAPQRVVIGGGVSKIDEDIFWRPVRECFARYAFGPLKDETEIVAAALGDDVVLYGAGAIASSTHLED